MLVEPAAGQSVLGPDGGSGEGGVGVVDDVDVAGQRRQRRHRRFDLFEAKLEAAARGVDHEGPRLGVADQDRSVIAAIVALPRARALIRESLCHLPRRLRQSSLLQR
ncbi:hypothetical protein MTBSS4_30050 [Magnetospirillum sp. SS-4]|nr:hypothetical protein MTBSS4_30050 [Magnetospirillum sp. SS-4]